MNSLTTNYWHYTLHMFTFLKNNERKTQTNVVYLLLKFGSGDRLFDFL